MNDPDFLHSIVNGHETWCFMCDPKTKHQSGERKLKDETKPKKCRFQNSKIKVMLITLIMHKKFEPEDQTVKEVFKYI